MFFWETSRLSNHILVRTVAIWCSGCSLTKPLQRDAHGNIYAVYNTDNSVLELLPYGESKDLVKLRRKFIVYAHLLAKYRDFIRPVNTKLDKIAGA